MGPLEKNMSMPAYMLDTLKETHKGSLPQTEMLMHQTMGIDETLATLEVRGMLPQALAAARGQFESIHRRTHVPERRAVVQ